MPLVFTGNSPTSSQSCIIIDIHEQCIAWYAWQSDTGMYTVSIFIVDQYAL